MRNGRLMALLLLLAPLLSLGLGWALSRPAFAAENLEVVRMVLAETEISPGASQLLQITLGNSGRKAILAGMKVDIRDANDRRIGASMRRKIKLGAKDEQRIFFPFKAPVAAGNYAVKFELLTPDFKRKLLSGGPVFFTPFSVGRARARRKSSLPQQARIGVAGFLPPAGLKFELPDLLWENLTLTPPNLLLGESLRVRGDLRNVGGDIARNVVVSVDYFNTRTPGRLVSVSRSDVNILAPGEKLEMEFEILLPDNAILGQYRVALTADVGDVVEESDEINNKLVTVPIRLSLIKLVFPEPDFAFDEMGLFLFRWDTLRYDQFKVQVGTDRDFSDKTSFFDIPQGEKWTNEKEIVPLEGELPAMAQGLIEKAKKDRLYWRVMGRDSKTNKTGISAVSSFTITPEKKEEKAAPSQGASPTQGKGPAQTGTLYNRQ